MNDTFHYIIHVVEAQTLETSYFLLTESFNIINNYTLFFVQ